MIACVSTATTATVTPCSPFAAFAPNRRARMSPRRSGDRRMRTCDGKFSRTYVSNFGPSLHGHGREGARVCARVCVCVCVCVCACVYVSMHLEVTLPTTQHTCYVEMQSAHWALKFATAACAVCGGASRRAITRSRVRAAPRPLTVTAESGGGRTGT